MALITFMTAPKCTWNQSWKCGINYYFNNIWANYYRTLTTDDVEINTLLQFVSFVYCLILYLSQNTFKNKRSIQHLNQILHFCRNEPLILWVISFNFGKNLRISKRFSQSETFSLKIIHSSSRADASLQLNSNLYRYSKCEWVSY